VDTRSLWVFLYSSADEAPSLKFVERLAGYMSVEIHLCNEIMIIERELNETLLVFLSESTPLYHPRMARRCVTTASLVSKVAFVIVVGAFFLHQLSKAIIRFFLFSIVEWNNSTSTSTASA
jgi:hypothetical protein